MAPAFKSFAFCCILALLAGCASAPIQYIGLNQASPELSNIAHGKAIVVGEFANGRNMLDGVPRDPGRFGSWRQQLDEACGDASVGEYFCIQGSTPEGLVRDALCGVLEAAGFKVFKDAKAAPAGALKAGGEVKFFYFVTEASAAASLVPGRSTAAVEFKLEFTKGGEVLGSKRIHAQIAGHPFMHGPNEGKEHVVAYLSKALNKAVRKASVYVASEEFQEDVLGIAHGKARRSVMQDDGDSGGAEEADSAD